MSLKTSTAPDPCICSPCDTFAKCTRISLSSMQFECVCEPGYIGSGFECTGKPLLDFCKAENFVGFFRGRQ